MTMQVLEVSENTIYFKITLDYSTEFRPPTSRLGDNPAVSGLIFTCYSLARCCFIFTLGDDTLKIWDLRNFKEYLNVAMNLTNYYPQ